MSARFAIVAVIALGSWSSIVAGAVVHEDELCSSSSSSWVLDSSNQFSWSSSGSCSLLADWIDENRNYAW